MNYYTELIDCIPVGIELTTNEIIKLRTGRERKDYEPWEWYPIKNRICTTLNKGVQRHDIVKVGYRTLPNEPRKVMVWMRV